jgi:hypothetical protein
MALDQNTRLKLSFNFGTRSNAIFGTRSKVSIIFITKVRLGSVRLGLVWSSLVRLG